MNKATRNILIAYFAIILLKIALALSINRPSIFSDEFFYFKMAQSFYHEHNLLVHSKEVFQYPPIYPMLIAALNLFKNTFLVYKLTQIANAFLSASIIFPAYFLAKEFLYERKALFISILIAIISPFFLISSYIMSENLFYPLFLLNIFLIYKSAKTNSTKLYILSGLLLGIAYLTKVLSITLLPVLFLLWIFSRKKTSIKISVKNLLVYYLIFFAVASFWAILNLEAYGSFINAFTGNYHRSDTELLTGTFNTIALGSFLNWLILYTSYLIFSSGVIFAMLYFYSYKIKHKNFKLLYVISLIVLASLIVISANHSNYPLSAENQPFKYLTGRTVGRYIESFLPLMLIISFITLTKIKPKLSTKSIFLFIILALFSLQLAIFPLFPLNNSSLTYLGITKYILDLAFTNISSLSSIPSIQTSFSLPVFIALSCITIASILTICYTYNKNNKNNKVKNNKVVYYISAFLILNTILASSASLLSSNQWESNIQNDLGLWLNSNNKENYPVYLDKSLGGKIGKENEIAIYEDLNNGRTSSILTFWIKSPVIIAAPSEIPPEAQGYFITDKVIDKSIAFKSSSSIKIYNLSKS